jgi:flagellar biosynthesis protein FlhA
MATIIPGFQSREMLAVVLRNGLAIPALLMALLAMMILPLPPLLLDVLFTFNISLSIVVLLASIYSRRPLDFAAFPTVLLAATLLRLALNIASTRVVLLHGHSGPSAAGEVIHAFGSFVIGGNYAVGFVVFAILVIINFVVVTKGAGRISEVSARFTLDAMPGKQMAIDADLNAGVLTQDEARKRRAEVTQEADFYGAMDGASKFVRGDAIAGILIVVINIIGGFIIGVAQHSMSMSEAVRVFTLLTIGDGLVAQIPGLLLAVASAVIVTRVSAEAAETTETGVRGHAARTHERDVAAQVAARAAVQAAAQDAKATETATLAAAVVAIAAATAATVATVAAVAHASIAVRTAGPGQQLLNIM